MNDVLAQSQLDYYRQNGFCVVDGIFDEAMIKRAREVTQDLLSGDISGVAEPEPENAMMARRIWSPTARDEVFARIADHPRLLDALQQLIGPNIVLQYSKLNVKPPKVGSAVEWHQDFAYYPHTNTDLAAALIYLDDASVANSALKVAAGSHRSGTLDHEVAGFFGGKIASLADVGVDPATVVDCEAPAGAVVFLHPLVVHSSEKNRSDDYRRVFIPAYRAADALPIYYGPHAAHNEPNARLLRGAPAKRARTEVGEWRLPIAAAEFNSLYQIQEGSHLTSEKTSTGYFSHEVSENAQGISSM